MGNQENPQSQNRNRSEVDSSIGARLAAAGVSTEELRKTVQNNEFKKLIALELEERAAQSTRNRTGNGRKAGPALVEALKDAGVVSAEERKKVRELFNKERKTLENEIEEAEVNIREALTLKKGREAHNWDVRLQKSKAILGLYEESASFIDSDTGKHILESLHKYAKARYDQARTELIADSFEATGKFVAQNPKEQPKEELEDIVNTGYINEETPPILTEEVDEGGLSVLNDIVSGPVITKFKGDDVPAVYMKDSQKLTPTETVSYPKATPSERISHPDKKPREISKVAPSTFGLHDANYQMQRDMNYLSRKTEEKLTPSETISYPQEEAEAKEQTPIMEKFESLATGDNWQEEAYSRYELARFENEGGRTIDTLEKDATPVSSEETSVETEQTVATPEVASLENEKKPRLTLEETMARIQKVEALVAERERNLGEKTMGYIRGVGETWSKFPTRHKLLISAAMLITGLSAVAAGSAAAAGTITAIGAGIRAAGASALFYSIETGLKTRAEKNGKEWVGAEAISGSVTAAAISIFVMGVLPSIASNVVEMFGSAEASEQIAKSGLEGAGATAPIVCAEIAQEGDTVWSMAERGISASLGEKFTSLSPEQQTYFIDAVKDQVVAHPDQFGLADANELQVGQGIDFGILLNNQEFMSETLAEAKGLSAEDIEGIRNYVGEELVDGGTAEIAAGTPEALSTDPQVLAIAGELYHNHVNDVFGSKGFFGFGATDGLKSPNWADASLGFANKTVEEIMNTKPVVLPGDGALIGIEDRASTEKMQAYFNRVFIETGIQPEQGETAEKFLKRVSVLSVMHKG